MRYIGFTTLLILASATLGLAQFDGTDLSADCTSELAKIGGSQEINACLPFASLIPLVSGGGSKPDPTAVAAAADKICGVQKCSTDLVTKTQTEFQTACKADLDAKKDAAIYINLAFELYSPTRDSICFKNSTGGYCFIESSMAADQVLQSAPKGQSPLLTFVGAPKEIVCTPCNKAIANTFFTFQKNNPDAFADIKEFNTQDVETFKTALTSKCGDPFLDGNVGDTTESPKTFQEQNSQKPSGASSLTVNGLSFMVAGSILALL